MTTDLRPAVDQLAEAIRRPVDRYSMYGLLDHDPPWRRPPESFARQVVLELRAVEDGTLDARRIAAEACLTVLEFVDVDAPNWWATPLGKLVMRAGPPGADSLSIVEACVALGVSRETVYRWAREERLVLAGRGRVTADSVRAVLTRGTPNP